LEELGGLMAHGGKREGAGAKALPPEPARRIGRKPKPRTQEEHNKSFDEKAIGKLPELFETVLAIAQGHKIAAYTRPRNLRSEEMLDPQDRPIYVYDVPPDKAAVFYLVDRAAGKSAVKPSEVAETELILEIGSMSLEAPTEALRPLAEDADEEGVD
jgi:hypothetical protein